MLILYKVSSFNPAFTIGEASDSSSKAPSHKYLQVELLADENVAARHGNDTADFLLVLANIVSCKLLNSGSFDVFLVSYEV